MADEVVQLLCRVLRNETIDWPSTTNTGFYEALVSQATYHGVDALVCHLLKVTPQWEKLPEVTREVLLQRLYQLGAIEMVRKRDLGALLAALAEANLSVLLLKGAALAYTHYLEPHLRPRVDTDLFINAADIGPIKQVFAELDYELVGRTYKSHQFNSRRTDFGGRTVNYDVHWRSNNRSLYARVISHEEALHNSVPVPGLPGARTLKPAYALLQACMHRASNPRHDPDRLIWLYDVHLLVTAFTEAELLEFARRAVTENLQRICRDALAKAHTLFGTQIPEAISVLLVTPDAGQRAFRQRIAESQLGLIVDDLRDLPDTRSRLDLLREYALPPADYLLRRYGKALRIWLPWLYLRYLATGLFERFSLR